MKKKYDPILYLILALLFAASVIYAFPRSGGGEIVIEAIRDGELAALGSLSEMAGSSVTFGEPGSSNEIAIGKGVRMVSADCPGGDCLRAGEIERSGAMIVCVPNRLVIRLASTRKPEVDAVSY